MVLRIMIGGALGLLAGAGIGYFLKSHGGTCPLTCHPVGAAIVGALFGGLIVSSLAATGGVPAVPAVSNVPDARTAEEFDKLLHGAGRPVLADFYTPNCGFCVKLAPLIDRLADEYGSRADFVKVDVGELPDLARRYRIRGVPVVILFSDGREVRRWVGLRDQRDYRSGLDAALGSREEDNP